MKRPKITVIGAGHVGEMCAQYAATKEVADVVLVDVIEGMPQGKALDLYQAAPIEGYDAKLIGTNSYEDTAGSDVIIITSGIPRKPGMSRDELLETNVKIVWDVTKKSVEHSPNAVLIVVTNPLDAMVYTAWKASGFPTNRVGCSVKDIRAMLLGGHGDDMVPLPRYTTVCGIPVTQLIPAGKLDEIVTRTRNGGAEIVRLLKTGSAYYAPSAGTIAMAASIIYDQKRILPCAAYCEKEYDVGGYFVGTPTMLGTNGVERIIEVELNAREKDMFAGSVNHVKELCAETEKVLSKR